MKVARSFLRLVMLAVALSGLAVSQAHASCTGTDQVSLSNSQCLTGTVTKNVFSDTWSVSSHCTAYGTVVAKIDTIGGAAPNQTVTLNSSTTTQSGTATRVDGIYCCKDLGDLCNRSDVVTAANCSSEFESSPAASSCTLSGTPTVDSNHTTCSFTAQCSGVTLSETIAYTDMDDLRYCTHSFTTASSCRQ